MFGRENVSLRKSQKKRESLETSIGCVFSLLALQMPFSAFPLSAPFLAVWHGVRHGSTPKGCGSFCGHKGSMIWKWRRGFQQHLQADGNSKNPQGSRSSPWGWPASPLPVYLCCYSCPLSDPVSCRYWHSRLGLMVTVHTEQEKAGRGWGAVGRQENDCKMVTGERRWDYDKRKHCPSIRVP